MRNPLRNHQVGRIPRPSLNRRPLANYRLWRSKGFAESGEETCRTFHPPVRWEVTQSWFLTLADGRDRTRNDHGDSVCHVVEEFVWQRPFVIRPAVEQDHAEIHAGVVGA